MKKSIDSSTKVDQKSCRHQNDKSRDRTDSRFTPTRQHPQPDLDHIHHRQHQKHATHDGSEGRRQHPGPQHLEIDVGPEGLVDILAVEQVEGQLESLCDQRREEEEAEGDNLEHQKLLRHVIAGVAGAVLEALLIRYCQRETHEDCDGEEGIHVDQAVQGGDVDASG